MWEFENLEMWKFANRGIGGIGESGNRGIGEFEVGESGNRVIRIIESSDERAIAEVLDRSPARNARVERAVAAIVADVRARGDAAVREYARRFDALEGEAEISRPEMSREAARVTPEVRRALRQAARAIRHVAVRQVPRGWRTSPVPGVRIEQRV